MYPLALWGHQAVKHFVRSPATPGSPCSPAVLLAWQSLQSCNTASLAVSRLACYSPSASVYCRLVGPKRNMLPRHLDP